MDKEPSPYVLQKLFAIRTSHLSKMGATTQVRFTSDFIILVVTIKVTYERADRCPSFHNLNAEKVACMYYILCNEQIDNFSYKTLLTIKLSSFMLALSV